MNATRRLVGLAITVCVLWAPLGTGVADAAFPGADGRIAFVRSGVIYTMTPAGANLRRVTVGTKPRWSPDGGRLAMLRGGNVWVMNADGRRQRQLTRTGGLGAPAWSPDGTSLAAVYTTPVGGPSVVVRISSTEPFGIAATVTDQYVENRPIAWSPDGRSIAFNGGAFGGTYPCVDDGLKCISRVDVATGAVDVMTWTGGSVHSADDMYDANWNPDGSGILFSFVQTARDFSGDDSPLHVSVLQPSRSYTTDGGVYSPSGDKVAFTKHTGNTRQIYTAAADGTGWRRLAAGQDPDWQPVR